MPFPSDLPRPPFEFQVPGEQGNPTLCTDPDWTAAMLALDFLGLPYTVVNGGQDCAAPQLEMADEVYDDTHALTAMLEERYVLSDLVQTVDGVLRRVRALRTALETLLLAKEPPAEAAATAELAAELGRVEFRLKSRRDGGDFLEGDELTYGDLELGVTLHHLRAALPHFRPAWAWPEACELLRAYADAMTGMQVFAEVAPPAEAIVARYEALGAVVKAK
ncbi:putative dehydroascorbate reductase [Tribonema minus]|uniref:Putative dehydroascorbate reductase n=1 Tax=Tribonema minus TaxID=303371 RepID=A0A835Z1W6_9STRA|nr:putative dehydroascorbate reductase [Tribonema minus]